MAQQITAANVREINAQSGLAHAEFCVTQAETQFGSLPEARAELLRLEDAAYAEQDASVAGLTMADIGE